MAVSRHHKAHAWPSRDEFTLQASRAAFCAGQNSPRQLRCVMYQSVQGYWVHWSSWHCRRRRLMQVTARSFVVCSCVPISAHCSPVCPGVLGLLETFRTASLRATSVAVCSCVPQCARCRVQCVLGRDTLLIRSYTQCVEVSGFVHTTYVARRPCSRA